ncbi:replication protein [Listeria monocytogenes]|jgi:Fe2+ or Zn2+ uptake regulation protein|nr:replication protein [Listeria monocytogenes]
MRRICCISYATYIKKGGIILSESEKVTLELTKEELMKFQRLMELQNEEENKKAKREEEDRNSNFVQFYRDGMPEMRWLMVNHQLASSLLFFILEHMDNRNALACSYSVFEDYFEKHKTTIYRNLKILEENGFIDILKMGTSNVYIVNNELAWTDKNSYKKFAKYDGKILVSKKENKDYEYRSQFERFKALREREGLK